MNNQPPWAYGHVPRSYERITWQERLERIPSDYGPPERTNGLDITVMTPEEEEAYWNEIIEMENRGEDIIF